MSPIAELTMAYRNKDAARILSVHPQTLARWRANGRGPQWIRMIDGEIVRDEKKLSSEQLKKSDIRYSHNSLISYLQGVR